MRNKAEVETLLAILPPHLQDALRPLIDTVEEVVLDTGRPVRVRHVSAKGRRMPLRELADGDGAVIIVAASDVSTVCDELAFDTFNRSTVASTLHRVARFPLSPDGQVPGLTLRVGRHTPFCVAALLDVVLDTTKSMLLLGPPGVGKTTILREVASLMAARGASVIVVDKSNEIAGGDVVPHPAIGSARRMMVATRTQDATMLEAVINHNPDAIVVDEMGTAQEARAAANIAQRGVRLVATAHGNDFSSVVKDPQLNRVVGGIHNVVQGDARAMAAGSSSNGRQARKTCAERQNKPVFDVVVEIRSRYRFRVHHDAIESVDALLADDCYTVEERTLQPATSIVTCRMLTVTPGMCRRAAPASTLCVVDSPCGVYQVRMRTTVTWTWTWVLMTG